MNNSLKSVLHRQGSVDMVRKKVEEEGRSARNLITWSVPLESDGILKGTSKSPVTTPKKSQRARSTSSSSQKVSTPRDRTMSPSLKAGQTTPETSAHQNVQILKKDLRARYWAFLFENLKRAVDEIYSTCEADESVVECKEAIMILEQSTRDFKSLIQRLELLRAYENADENERPLSLAWEVRKISPGKSLSQSQVKDHLIPSSTVSRTLTFTSTPKETLPVLPPGNSWADRVKNSPPLTAISQSKLCDDHSQTETEDKDGWETVQKGKYGKLKRSHSGSIPTKSPCQSSPKELSPNTFTNNVRKTSTEGHSNNKQSGDRKGSPLKEHANRAQRTTPRKSSAVGGSKSQVVNRSEREKTGAGQADYHTDDQTNDKPSPSVQPHKKKTDSAPNLSATTSFTSEAVVVSLGEEKSEVLRQSVSETYTENKSLDDALTSALDEEESLGNQLEKENEEALQQANVEELNYLQEIAREQSMEIEVETEPETEADSDLANTGGSVVSQESESKVADVTDWDSLVKQFEAGSLMKQSWGDMVEEEEIASRTPGRGVHMHEKLSSPSRKRSPKESRKRHEEKQAKAQELREKLMQERTERIRMLTNKVEEVRVLKGELYGQKKDLADRKMQQAEEKRQYMLQSKIRKAHEEEAKANEIAFINSLEAQNKLHDIRIKHEESKARLQDIQDERQRKSEEEAAKKLAVEERRKALDAERQAKLLEMHEKRAEREKIAEHRQQEREKERQEAKRVKEKEREERLSLLNQQHEQHIENLKSKIKQKQSQTEQRHREKLDQIREKAFEMSILRHSSEDHNEAPLSVPYETKKFCAACNVMISSEVHLSSHLLGRKHQEAIKMSYSGRQLFKTDIESFNLKHILDAPLDKPDPRTNLDKERQKSLKKRCKKLRQRMCQRGAEYENALSGKQQTVDSQHRAKLQKLVKDLNKYVSTPDKGPWPQNKVSALDRALGEISRILEKKVVVDQAALRLCGGLTTLNRILLVGTDVNRPDSGPVIPVKSLVLACNVFRLACRGYYDNCHYVMFSNKLGSLVDLLIYQLNILIPENFCSLMYHNSTVSSSSSSGSVVSSASSTTVRLPTDPLSSALVQLLATIMSCLAKHAPSPVVSSEASTVRMSGISGGDPFTSRVNDIVSYAISVGVVDKVSTYLDNVRGPLQHESEAADFVQHCLSLLIALTRLLTNRSNSVFNDSKRCGDPTHLSSTFEMTNLCGIVSLMYGLLLHSDAPARATSNIAPKLPTTIVAILSTGFKMLNQLALLDLHLLQSTLGSEGVSLEFRHIASYLLWSCNNQANEELLHEVILSVGYFTYLSPDNQYVIQSGQPPTVLQQLCQLPFQYFSDPRLTTVLFPTLIACCYRCHGNKDILQQELSCVLLTNFIEENSLEVQHMKLASAGNKNKSKDKDGEERMSFAVRIPQEEWSEIQAYFTNSL